MGEVMGRERREESLDMVDLGEGGREGGREGGKVEKKEVGDGKVVG